MAISSFRVAIAAVSLLALAACGGGGNGNGNGDTGTTPPTTTPPPTSTPPPPTTPAPDSVAGRISAAFAAIFGQGADTEGKDPADSDLPPVNFDQEPVDF
ncbi:MAG: hypothetical protein AVDCRST_MAG39-2726 [uncultured Sphingomonadaceae bacterium]|uniref:Uncharacterized protein n=1 Tax=uncultured Sphingomonadaceae bacterium TaxID=169976 RepID=A0A6J4TI62_9SPHN|nr:MAG: hypothetical protein AVDCRST_MAG39-2726 [uncultured Sphingomonadaceae bacterium]